MGLSIHRHALHPARLRLVRSPSLTNSLRAFAGTPILSARDRPPGPGRPKSHASSYGLKSAEDSPLSVYPPSSSASRYSSPLAQSSTTSSSPNFAAPGELDVLNNWLSNDTPSRQPSNKLRGSSPARVAPPLAPRSSTGHHQPQRSTPKSPSYYPKPTSEPKPEPELTSESKTEPRAAFSFKPSPYHLVKDWKSYPFHPQLQKSLATKFPQVVSPTPFQAQLLEASRTGRDIFARQGTGSGKSFALLLALLNQRYPSHFPRPAPPLSLLLLPSTALVSQIHMWATSLQETPDRPLTIPIVTPDRTAPSLLTQVQPLLNQSHRSPKIIIATPAALLAALNEPAVIASECHTLGLDTIRTIAIDEADTTLGIPSSIEKKAQIERNAKRKQKIGHSSARNHASPGLSLMRAIFELQSQRKLMEREERKYKPQVIMVSASLTNDAKIFADESERWIHPPASRIELEPAQSQADDELYRMRHLDQAKSEAGLSSTFSFFGAKDVAHEPPKVIHHVVLVTAAGTVHNLSTSTPLKEPFPPYLREEDVLSSHPAVTRRSMDAFAQLWHSLEPKPLRSLLILPSGGNLQKIERELKTELEIHAENVASAPVRDRKTTNDNVTSAPTTTTTTSSSSSTSTSSPRSALPSFLRRTADRPIVYLVDQAFVRGLDVPSITHVFIFSNALRDSSDYLHAAGRVGRLSSSSTETGKTRTNSVFTIVDLPRLQAPSQARTRKIVRRLKVEHDAGLITEEQLVHKTKKAWNRLKLDEEVYKSEDGYNAERGRIEGMFDELKDLEPEARSKWTIEPTDLVE